MFTQEYRKEFGVRIKRIPGSVLCASAIILIGLIDYITGGRVDFSIFFFLPVAFAAVYWRLRTGVAVALVATVVYFLSCDFVFIEPWTFLYVNTLLHGIAFLLIGAGGRWLKENFDSVRFVSKPLKRWLVVVFVVASLFLTFRLGHARGVHTDFSIFYFIPVILTSIAFGRRYGIFVALISATLCFILGFGSLSSNLVFWKNLEYYWDIVFFAYLNTVLHGVAFIVMSMVYARGEKVRIEQRSTRPRGRRALFPTLYLAFAPIEPAGQYVEPPGKLLFFQPLWLFLQRVVHDRVALAFLVVNAAKVAFFGCLVAGENLLFDSVYFFITSVISLGTVAAYLFASRSRLPFVVFYFAQLIYFCVNTAYFNFFEYYLTIDQALEYLWQLGPVVRSLPPVFSPDVLIYLIDFPLFLMLICRNFPVIKIQVRFLRLKTIAALVCLAALLFLVNGFGITTSSSARVSDPEYRDQHIAHDVGLPLFQIHDFIRFVSADEQMALRHELKPSSHRMQFDAKQRKANIVLIQVEALDAAIVMARHHGAPVMPYLSSLRSDCVYYPYTLCYHAGGGSSDAEFVALNSMEPLYLRSVYFQKNYFFPNAIVKVMRNSGYNVVAFHANRGETWNRAGAYKRMGYQQFWDLKASGLTEVVWGAPDSDLFRFVEKKLPTVKPPFFAHIITMSTHYPYSLTRSYFHDPAFDDISDEMQRDYFNCCRYADWELKGFIKYLRSIPNTYIIIYGDHPCTVQTKNFRASKQYVAGRNLEFVPVYIITPKNAEYREDRCVASMLDIAPTIMHASGVGGSYSSYGQDLLEHPIKDSPLLFYNAAFSRSKLFEECTSPPSAAALAHQFPVKSD